MAQRISCFATPSFAIAKRHPSNYYSWMLNGAALYAELLSSGYKLFAGRLEPRRPTCFETFPHAIACALQGKIVSAKHKRPVRRALLQRNGIDTRALTNIDWIDAALCALAACHLVSGSIESYGDGEDGFIVVPGEP
jgi:hypothetical protein